jgi:predicted phage terminase large subunit-like protein
VTPEQEARGLFEATQSPAALGRHLGLDVLGRAYKVYPWVRYIEGEILEMLARPDNEILIVNLPPQQGKTTYAGMWLPFWYLGLNPEDLIIFVAYNEEYASTWGRNVRDLVDRFGASLFGIGLNKSLTSVGNWRTTRGFGGMLSAGIGGGITGNPGHFIIIDDVIKGMEDAYSPTLKRNHLREWDGSISARMQNNTKVLITATRWSEDDLSGEIYNRSIVEAYDGIPVRQIRIKAVAEPDEEEELQMSPEQLEEWRDILGRRRGETLQGQHRPLFFQRKRGSVDTFAWHAQYQASPSARKGSMFPMDKWMYYDPANRPAMTMMRRVWDVAATEGGGDYTVGSLVGKDADSNFYVLDVQREQLSTSNVKALIKRTAMHADGRGVPIRMEQEKAGAGKTVIAFYDVELAGFQFQSVKAEGEKVSRFTPYSNLQQSHKVFLPRNPDGTHPDWVDRFIAEHKAQMPDGRGPKYDDQIDTVAYAVIEMYDLGPMEVTDPNEGVPTVDQLDSVDTLLEEWDITLESDLPYHLAAILGRDTMEEDPVALFVEESEWA